jgi:hypothetical protein
MYYDDNFDPAQPNDTGIPQYEKPQAFNSYDDDNSSTTASVVNKKNANLKPTDKNYHKITLYHKIITKKNGKQKPDTVELYDTTLTPGSVIRDAVTGSRMNKCRVGSRDEHFFFKTRLAINGVGLFDNNTFYFDSPEQFERVLFIPVSQEIKEKWHARLIEERLLRSNGDK